MSSQRILVTGVTGYIGGRLVPRLLECGFTVRCLVRDPARMQGRPWQQDVEVVAGDALDYNTLLSALEGVHIAYYLIHSLAEGKGVFEEWDHQASENFGRAACVAGVKRIIYLGGLEPKGVHRSLHLRSRLETGEYLRSGGVPVTEFRAGVIVGSGGLSFELIRYITERVPIILCPRWVQTPTQPIAIRTVIYYLIEALNVPESTGRIIEIGGESILSYGDMFRIYARVRGLKRRIISIPIMMPRLGSYLVSFVTPFPIKIVRPLIEGLNNELTVRDSTARELFDIRPLSYEEAVRLALKRFTTGTIETTWHDAISSSVRDGTVLETLEHTEGMIRLRKHMLLHASPSSAFQVIKSLGGETGWLYGHLLWRIRGFIDLIVGGVGLRRGRRSPTDVRVGDALDFWRVEALEEDRLLRFHAEMKTPGHAWLQFDIKSVDGTCTRVRQTAYFEPKGLWGLIYWYSLYPIHQFIFKGMIRELYRRIVALEADRTDKKKR